MPRRSSNDLGFAATSLALLLALACASTTGAEAVRPRGASVERSAGAGGTQRRALLADTPAPSQSAGPATAALRQVSPLAAWLLFTTIVNDAVREGSAPNSPPFAGSETTRAAARALRAPPRAL